MPNNSIPDEKKAAICALSSKYGYRAIASRLDLNYKTVKRYVEEVEESGSLEMDSEIDLEITNAA